MNEKLSIKYKFILILLGSTILYWLLIFSSQLFYIDDKLFVVLGDDAMISMRYAKNWADGLGIFWNPGGSPEGYTNFLLVSIMAFIHMFSPGVETASLYVLIFNWIIHIFIISLTYVIALKIYKNDTNALLSSFFMAFSLQFLLWGSNGFETTLLSLFSLIAIYFIINKQFITASIAMALGVLVRDDFTIFVFVFGTVFSLMLTKGLKKQFLISLKLSSIPLFVFIIHLVWRHYYYGDFLPNTYYLKATGWIYSAKIQEGLGYILGLMPIILSSLFAYYLMYRSSKIKEEQALYATFFFSILFYSLYIINVGGDAFWGGRLFAAIFPFFAIAGAYLLKKYRHLLSLKILIIFVFIVYPINKGLLSTGYGKLKPIVNIYGTPYDKIGFPPHYNKDGDQKRVPANVRNILSCQLIKKHALENIIDTPSMAVYYAGIPPYMCYDFIAIDLLGKSDSYIAHSEAHPGRVGHNKYDYEYSLNKFQPTYILSLMPSINSLTDSNYIHRPMGDFNWHLLLNSSQFMTNYGKQYLRPEIAPIFIRNNGNEHNISTL